MPATPYALTDAANAQWSQAQVAIPQEWSDIERHYNILTRVTKELLALVNGADAGGDLQDYTGNGIIDRLYTMEETNALKNLSNLLLGDAIGVSGNRSLRFCQTSAAVFAQLMWDSAANQFRFSNQDNTLRKVKAADATAADDLITKGQVDAAFAALVVFNPGDIMDTASSSANTKWTFCDGKALSRSTYSELFTRIGTTYGVGNGSTTFNVPDLRGRLRMAPDNLGGVSANRVVNASADVIGGTLGAETQTLSTANLATHSHNENFWMRQSISTGGSTTVASHQNAGIGSQSGGISTDSAGSGTAFDKMPPVMSIPVMIYTGV